MSKEQPISLDDLYQAIRVIDPDEAYKQITHNLTKNNTLSSDKPWWVFSPYGSWNEPLTLPTPSPLEHAVLQAIPGGGEANECFIDITNLEQGDAVFFTDQYGNIVQALANFINSLPSTVTPVIRYLLGFSRHQRPQDDGFVKALYDGNRFKHPTARLYCGNFSPSFPYITDGRMTTDVLPGGTVNGIIKWLEDEIRRLWDWFKGEVRKYASEMYRELQKMESVIIPWIKRYIHISPLPVSWNHAKIFAVNGKNLVTGGANYWSAYATGKEHDFVFDLSMSINGGAAVDAHAYADYFWGYLWNIPPTDEISWCQTNLLKDDIGRFQHPEQMIPMYTATPAHAGNISALSVAKNGNWPSHYLGVPAQIFDAIRDFILNLVAAVLQQHHLGSGWITLAVKLLDDDNEEFRKILQDAGISPAAWMSRHIRNVAVARAQRCVRMSQQTFVQDAVKMSSEFKKLLGEINSYLGTNWDGCFWPYDTMMALGYALANISNRKAGTADCGVELVVSTTNAAQGGYQDNTTAAAFKDKLAGIMSVMHDLGYIKLTGSSKDVIKNFLAYKRIDDNLTNPKHATHAKLAVVDDSVCYIGSDNAYPSYNQEFGLWIDDRDSINAFIKDYWNHLWNFAQPATR